MLAGAGEGEEIGIYDISKGGRLKTLNTELMWVRKLEKIGRNHVAYTSSDYSIYSSELDSEEESDTYSGHIDDITSLRRLPNDFFFSSSKDSTVRLWRLGQTECLYSYTRHTGPVVDTGLIPRRNWIASVSNNEKVIRVWDMQTLRDVTLIPVNEKTNCIKVDPRQLLIFVASSETHCVKIFDLRTQIRQNRWEKPLRILDLKNCVNTMTYFYDDDKLITADQSGNIGHFDIRNISKQTHTLQPPSANFGKSKSKKMRRTSSMSNFTINCVRKISDDHYCVCNEGGMHIYHKSGTFERLFSTKEEIYTVTPMDEDEYDDILGLRVIDDSSDEEEEEEGEKENGTDDSTPKKPSIEYKDSKYKKSDGSDFINTYLDYSKLNYLQKFMLFGVIWTIICVLIFGKS